MKRKIKKIFAAVSLILIISLVLPMFSGIEVQEVQAAKRLQGIQKIVNTMNKDKFTVLEIVPDRAFSSFGYYVSRFEPQLDEKIIRPMLSNEIITDVPEGTSTTGYAERYSEVVDIFNPITAKGSNPYEAVARITGNIYTEQLYADANTANWKVISAHSGESFYDIRQGDYVLASSAGATVGDYNVTTNEDGTIASVEYKPGEGSYVWYDTNGGTLQVVQFQNLYYKTSVTSNDWIAKKVLELGGVLSAEDGEYVYGSVTTHNIEVITVTPEELEERFNVTSEGALQLKDIDLVYLSNSSCLDLPEDLDYDLYDRNISYTIDKNKQNDISWETAYNIFEYIINTNLPIIVDDSIIPPVTPTAEGELALGALLVPNNNIIRLAYMLKNYTEEYTGTQTVNGQTTSYKYRYTFENYKHPSITDYVIPSELPSEVDTRSTEDAKVGAALNHSISNYSAYEVKLANKTATVYGSVYVDVSDKNLVHNLFAINAETIEVDETEDINESVVYGVQAVVDDIHTENFYYNLDSDEFTTEYVKTTSSSSVQVSDATLIKYIVNFKNRRIEIYKDKITVLDVEPTKYSQLDVDDVKEWIGTIADEKIKEIEIVQTSTKEFIGKIDDLNKEYDLIYFGSCVGDGYIDSYEYDWWGNITGPTPGTYLNGSITQDDQGNTDYNDTGLDNLIYTHVGDIVDITDRAGGLLYDEYTTDKTSGKTVLSDDSITTRYSGNDITKTKVNQLIEFVESGYPVVISSDFYTDSDTLEIDTNRVDKNSHMYEFMSACVDEPNVFKESDGLDGVLPDYINMPKLNLAMISQPDEYTITEEDGSITSVNYLQSLNGRNVLIYSFEFSNTSEGNSNTNDYQVQLYVDINADGQFDKSEELDSLEVMTTSTLEAVEYDDLKPNVRYTVSRELPKDYVGIIPWQLKVSMVEFDDSEPTKKVDSRVRTTAEGFTAVKPEVTTEVKVLQIASLQMTYDEYSGMSRETYYTGLILPYDELLDTQIIADQIPETEFDDLFDDLLDHMGFDINVDVISVDGYVSKYNSDLATYVEARIQEYQEKNKNATEEQLQAERKQAETDAIEYFYKTFFVDYDMIIMGFEDCYEDIANAGSVQAIDMFIKSGRSVLFAHDTTSYFNVDLDMYEDSGETHNSGRPWYHWGYHLNKYIRSDVGMDRYGITEENLSILKGEKITEDVDDISSSEWGNYITVAASLDKEVPYYSEQQSAEAKSNVAHEVHGFTDGLIDTYLENGSDRHNTYVSSTDYYSNSITQVNRGQITTYPYNINIEQDADEDLRNSVSASNTTYFSMNPSSMTVAPTHAQYYQLDMNIDKDNDNNADMVVWYCLSDGRNEDFVNDVRNNYYIYSVGNVTYTGMGHYQDSTSAAGLSEAEAKLFVNTIMASLNSGKKDPGVNIVANSTNKNTSLSYLYRTYDQDIAIEDTSNVDLYFYATDMNIINGTKTILTKFYYEIPTATGADVEIFNSDDTTTYLKEIPTYDNGLQAMVSSLPNVVNGQISQVSIGGSWINYKMKTATEGLPFKIYVGVQTMMNSSQNEGEYEYTAEVFDSLTFKQRNLFNLD